MSEIKLREIPKVIRYVCIHWTAGTYTQSEDDYRHYHFTVGSSGNVTGGKFKPQDNIPPLANGKYAAHCGGGNSYCMGIALRGMLGYKSPKAVGKFPLLKEQCEAAWAFIAKFCKEHGIEVTPETVFTHYEFGKRHPSSDSAGKVDITHLPYEPNLQAEHVGDYIRRKVKWYLKQLEAAT